MSTPAVDAINNESITAHFTVGQLEDFSKGDVLVQEDEQPLGVYLVQSGYVNAYSISPLGQLHECP